MCRCLPTADTASGAKIGLVTAVVGKEDEQRKEQGGWHAHQDETTGTCAAQHQSEIPVSVIIRQIFVWREAER